MPAAVRRQYPRAPAGHVHRKDREGVGGRALHDLARIEVGDGHDPHLGEAKGIFNDGHHAHHDGIIDGAAQYRRDLDLDLHAPGADDQLGDDILVG